MKPVSKEQTLQCFVMVKTKKKNMCIKGKRICSYTYRYINIVQKHILVAYKLNA